MERNWVTSVMERLQDQILCELISDVWRKGNNLMPQITKQTRTTSGPTRTSSSSVLSEAVPVDQLQDDFVKIVIYGQNRTGKTTLACQFPKPLLLVSFEPALTGGARSVKSMSGVTYLRVDNCDKALSLVEELKANKTYKTHVWDGVSNYERMQLAEVLGVSELTEQLGKSSHGGITRDHYSERTERTKNGLKRLMALKANTVLICREKDHQPPKDQFQPKILRGLELESFFAADLSGGTVGWLHDACDGIVRLYMEKEIVTKTYKAAGKEVEREEETGKLVRRLRLKYHTNFAAGLRSPNPELVPEYIEAESPEEMYSELMRILNGEEA